MSYTNQDGLRVLTDADQGVAKTQGTAVESMKQILVVDLTFTAIGATFTAANIDPLNPVIPANSLITRADIVMTTTATAGGAATLTVGTYNAAGTAIQAAGIDSAVALASLTAGSSVRCDGVHLTTSGLVTVDTYIGATVATGPYTAGVGKLYVEYVKL